MAKNQNNDTMTASKHLPRGWGYKMLALGASMNQCEVVSFLLLMTKIEYSKHRNQQLWSKIFIERS